MSENQAVAVAGRPSLITKMAGMYNMEPAKFANTIKSTCIKGRATDEQFAAFLMVADKYGLNPLTKEIYAFPQDGGIVPIVGVDGWARIINDHPAFDGMDFEDTLSESGEIVAITCRIHRKDRSRPIEAKEYLAECRRGTQPWKQWPSRMLRHKAMIQAARYAFGYTGIFEEDEYERRREAERAAASGPAKDRFASMREQTRQLTFDAEPETVDEAPVKDVSADLDDSIPDFDDETAGEATPSAEPVQEGVVETPEPNSQLASDDPAPSEQSEPQEDDSIKRWYVSALSSLKRFKSADDALEKLRALQDEPMWFEISDTQAQTLIKAAER